MAVQETTLCEGILLNTFQTSSMIRHLAYISTRLFPTNTSDSKTTLNDLFMGTLALFQCCYTSTHSAPPQKWQHLAALLPVAFLYIVPMPSVLALISQVLTTWHSKRLRLLRSSCWTLLQHPPCFHIWHTCQQGYCPQKRQTHNHFQQSVYEHTYPLQEPLNWHKHSGPPQKWQGLVAFPFHLLK